jgi:hypothetical protein
MDFMTYQGNDAILVAVVDQLSKLAKFMPTKATLMIIYIITLLFEMWVTHNNMLEVIMSDYDTKFTSNFWKVLINKAEIMLKCNMAFHPQIDGLTKRVNRVLNQYFWNYVGVDHKDWGNDLGLTKFC